METSLPITLEDCDVGLEVELDPGRSIVVVPQTHEDALSKRQLVDDKDQRSRFLSWLLNVGRHPKRAEGYSEYTVYSDAYRGATFDKWVWASKGRYPYPPEEEDALEYINHVAYSDTARVQKGKLQESIQHLNKWLDHTRGEPEWEFDIRFPSTSGNLETTSRKTSVVPSVKLRSTKAISRPATP